MRIEIRNDSVVIDGYVNAVERESRLIRDVQGDFIEKVKAGTFAKALKKANEVRMLLNHDDERLLGSTKNGNLELHEDNIGLRAIATVSDAEVIEKAKNGELRGWSFGFYVNEDEWEERENAPKLRTLTDIDLEEVSLIDNSKLPAYIATSVETRNDKEEVKELRELTGFKVVTEDLSKRNEPENNLKEFKSILEKLKK